MATYSTTRTLPKLAPKTVFNAKTPTTMEIGRAHV